MGRRGAAGGDRRRRVDAVVSPSTSLEGQCNLSAVLAMSELQGWADLPDGLLHSIVALLCSFPDLLAFAATSRSWRDALSSYPSKHTFSTLVPPLLLQPDTPFCSPCPGPVSVTDNCVLKHPCHVTDLANQGSHRCCQIPLFAERNNPPSPLDEFCFRGCSYGHLILSSKNSCLLVDVFTGVSVSPPQLLVNTDTHICYGFLTAPPASPNSHLIVSTGKHNFFWRVGDRSWFRCSPRNGTLRSIVVFKGEVFGMDCERNVFTVHLSPLIHIQEIAVPLEGRVIRSCLGIAWLVACTDMLLWVGFQKSFVSTGQTIEAFCLDLSTEPANWVKVDKLQNRAIFVSTDERSQPLCCMNPERWGGRSNCIYCYIENHKHWMAFELGEPPKGDAYSPSVFTFICCYPMLKPMWVVPSMFSSYL